MKRYVQFGCGFKAPAEWVNYDSSPTLRLEKLPLIGGFFAINKQRFPSNVKYGDIVKGLPESANSCDGLFSSHVLEHLAYNDFIIALKNSYNILKPGGIFRAVVPDLKYSVLQYIDKFDEVDAPANELMRNTLLGVENRAKTLASNIQMLYGNSKHLWMWDYKSLAFELKKAGFVQIRQAEFRDSSDQQFSFVEEEKRFLKAAAFECTK